MDRLTALAAALTVWMGVAAPADARAGDPLTIELREGGSLVARRVPQEGGS